jgi:hypothetical protein
MDETRGAARLQSLSAHADEVIKQACRMTAIGTKRTCRDVFYLAAFGGKADIVKATSSDRDWSFQRRSPSQQNPGVSRAPPRCATSRAAWAFPEKRSRGRQR